MLVPSIIFLTVLLSGFVFWFYNKKRVTKLVENIDDKQAIINALTNHVETTHVHSSHSIDSNGNANGKVKIKKRNKTNDKDYRNKQKKKNPIPFNPAESEIIVDLRQEKKNRPKPRRKPKTQQ